MAGLGSSTRMRAVLQKSMAALDVKRTREDERALIQRMREAELNKARAAVAAARVQRKQSKPVVIAAAAKSLVRDGVTVSTLAGSKPLPVLDKATGAAFSGRRSKRSVPSLTHSGFAGVGATSGSPSPGRVPRLSLPHPASSLKREAAASRVGGSQLEGPASTVTKGADSRAARTPRRLGPISHSARGHTEAPPKVSTSPVRHNSWVSSVGSRAARDPRRPSKAIAAAQRRGTGVATLFGSKTTPPVAVRVQRPVEDVWGKVMQAQAREDAEKAAVEAVVRRVSQVQYSQALASQASQARSKAASIWKEEVEEGKLAVEESRRWAIEQKQRKAEGKRKAKAFQQTLRSQVATQKERERKEKEETLEYSMMAARVAEADRKAEEAKALAQREAHRRRAAEARASEAERLAQHRQRLRAERREDVRLMRDAARLAEEKEAARIQELRRREDAITRKMEAAEATVHATAKAAQQRKELEERAAEARTRELAAAAANKVEQAAKVKAELRMSLEAQVRERQQAQMERIQKDREDAWRQARRLEAVRRKEAMAAAARKQQLERLAQDQREQHQQGLERKRMELVGVSSLEAKLNRGLLASVL